MDALKEEEASSKRDMAAMKTFIGQESLRPFRKFCHAFHQFHHESISISRSIVDAIVYETPALIEAELDRSFNETASLIGIGLSDMLLADAMEARAIQEEGGDPGAPNPFLAQTAFQIFVVNFCGTKIALSKALAHSEFVPISVGSKLLTFFQGKGAPLSGYPSPNESHIYTSMEFTKTFLYYLSSFLDTSGWNVRSISRRSDFASRLDLLFTLSRNVMVSIRELQSTNRRFKLCYYDEGKFNGRYMEDLLPSCDNHRPVPPYITTVKDEDDCVIGTFGFGLSMATKRRGMTDQKEVILPARVVRKSSLQKYTLKKALEREENSPRYQDGRD